MPKSKTKNRKKAQIRRQQKKQREAIQSNEIVGKSALEKRLKQDYKDVGIQIRNNNNSEIKISNLVLQLIAPLMNEAKSFDEESNIAGLGVMAWNLGIIKASKGENEMLKSLDSFGMEIPLDYKNLLLKYAEKKCLDFPDYNNIIYDYEFKSIDDQNNNLSVAYQPINKE